MREFLRRALVGAGLFLSQVWARLFGQEPGAGSNISEVDIRKAIHPVNPVLLRRKRSNWQAIFTSQRQALEAFLIIALFKRIGPDAYYSGPIWIRKDGRLTEFFAVEFWIDKV